MQVDFTIIAGCAFVCAAFGYMLVNHVAVIIVFALAAGAYFFMQEQNKTSSGSVNSSNASVETRRIQRELDRQDAISNRKKQIAGEVLRKRIVQKEADEKERKRKKKKKKEKEKEKERRLLVEEVADRKQRAEDRRLAKAALLRRTEARRRKSIDPAAGNPLDDFDEWLHDIEAPPSWINTVVFCVAHLAEELTGFRPGDYGIDEFTTQSGVNSQTIVDYVRDAKYNSEWLDNRFDPDVAKSGPTACPGIGKATGKILAKKHIRTTRQLLEKFNSFSGLRMKSQYRR